MGWLDIFILVAVAIAVIVGVYQFYFYPQNHPIKGATTPSWIYTRLDKAIKFDPRYVWVYSFFYYPFIIFAIFVIDNFRDFVYITSSFLLLALSHLVVFFAYPIKTPDDWRQYDKNANLSTRFLSLVQGYDKATNCFPSMHVAIASLSAYHVDQLTNGEHSFYLCLVPLIITYSCFKIKQHYIIDAFGGAITSWVIFQIYQLYS